MKPFWSATPSQAERTHEWDVSGTDWDLYPKGQCLRSPAFPCGGLDGWTMKFYPDGVGSVSEAVLFIKSAREPQVMVKLQYRVESKESPNVSSNCYVDMNRRDRNFYGFIPHVEGVVGVDKISVTVTCVKRKYQPEDVQQVPCIKGDVLRVVSDSTAAEESFFVVGCQAQFEFKHNCYLGHSGEVVAVERFSIQLKHHDGTLLLWGHGALLPGSFTSLEVDAMKVSTAQTVHSGDLTVHCKSHVCCNC